MSSATVLPPAQRGPAPVDPAVPATRLALERPLPLLSFGQWAGQINRQLADCRRQRSTLAVLVVALDVVRVLDPSGQLGDPAGPDLTERTFDHVAQRLRTRVRSTDRVVRIGERHLGLVLSGAPAALSGQIESRLVPGLVGPYRVDAVQAIVQLRSAVAVHPQDGTSGEALLRSLGDLVDAPTPGA